MNLGRACQYGQREVWRGFANQGTIDIADATTTTIAISAGLILGRCEQLRPEQDEQSCIDNAHHYKDRNAAFARSLLNCFRLRYRFLSLYLHRSSAIYLHSIFSLDFS